MVEKIVSGGWGLVRGSRGTVLVTGVLPGEEINYSLRERAKGINWGQVHDIICPSPDRIPPPCPEFGSCGGCTFQHIPYKKQCDIKAEIVKETMRRIAGVDCRPERIYPSPEYGYRIRARLKGCSGGKLGFIKKGTTDTLAISNCLLLFPAMNALLKRWNESEPRPFFHQVDLLHNTEENQIYAHLSHPPTAGQRPFLDELSADGYIFSWPGNEKPGISELSIKGNRYLVSPAAFFQVNAHQWPVMLRVVEEYLGPCQTIVDLYSGVGFFIPLLRIKAERVVAVESAPFSVKLARRAFPEVEIVRSTVEGFSLPECDTIVADPPRAGLGETIIRQLDGRGVKAFIYLSCSPPTFARDFKFLKAAGFRMETFTMIDLFPQTPHIELISLFHV